MANIGFGSGFLSDAATGYFEGLFKPNLDEVRAKREQETRDKEADILLKHAHALYYGRPTKTTGGVPDYLETSWGVYMKDPVSGQLELKHSKPADQPKYDDILKGVALRGMEAIIGKPHAEWNDEDARKLTTDPKLVKLMDVYKTRPDIVVSPGGTGGVIPRDVAREGKPGANTPAAPLEEKPALDKPPPGAAKTPPATGKTSVPVDKAPPGVTGQADPVIVKHYAETRWKTLPQAEAQKQFDVLRRDPKTQPVNLASALEAFHQRYGVWPEGMQVETREGIPPKDSPKTPPSVSANPPTDTTTQKPAAAPSGKEPFAPYRSPEQEQDAKDKAEEQQRQREAAARAQAQLDVTLRNEQRDNAKMAQHLKEYEEAKKAKNLAAQERIQKNIELETRDYRAQIAGADETIALLQEMAQYVTPRTVGATGAVRQMWQNLMGQFERSHRVPLTGEAGDLQRKVMPIAGKLMQEAQLWQSEENVRARAEGRIPTKIYVPDYSKYDPSMTFIAFLKEVIGYAQARAMNGIGRLTDQDLDRAKVALGIDDWTKSAAHVQTSLLYVSKELKNKKERIEGLIEATDKRLRRYAPKAGESGAETGESAKE